MPARRPPATRRDNPNDLAGLRVGLYCRVSQDEGGDEKSVGEQEAAGREWVKRERAILSDVYKDNDVSASRFTRKERKDFIRLLGDIEAGKLDLIWFWELSRSQRRLDVFAKLRDLCRDQGVRWVVAGRTYDLSDYMDAAALGLFAVFGESESEVKSARTRRGVAGNIGAGYPHGPAPYGYKRFKNPLTGRFDRQDPDVFDGNGRALEDTPAAIVREIFTRFAAGTGIRAIAYDLHARGIPSPWGATVWRHSTIRKLLLCPAYAGLCVHRGEIQEGVKAQWPALVDLEAFWTVRRTLSDPARQTGRPSRAKHLLSYLVLCDECGGQLAYDPDTQPSHRHRTPHPRYACFTYGCRRVSIRQPQLDEYVERVMVRWLADPGNYTALIRGDDSAAAARARADAEQLRAELAEWRSLAEAGEVAPITFARVERDRLAKIAEAEQREQATTLPSQLAGVIGPEAADRWAKLEVGVKRQIIREVADIRIRRAGKGQWRNIPIRERVKWTPLLGPAAERT